MALKNLYKKHKFNFIIYLLCFTIPVLLFGINDVEDYELGLLTTKIIWLEVKNPFVFFYDFFGPGVKIPLGTGPFAHLLNFFIGNIKNYYFFFIIFQILLQCIFLKKILNKFHIKYNENLFYILVIFSTPNLHYLYSDDWIACFFGFTFFPVIFYYLLKFIQTDKLKYAIYLSLLTYLFIINSHIGHTIVYIVFFLLWYFFSIKNFKNIFSPKVFLFLIFCLMLLAEFFYFIIREKNLFDIFWKSFSRPYDLEKFISIFSLDHMEWKPFDNRSPGNPILFFSVLIIAIINFVKFSIYLFKKKNNFIMLISKINDHIYFKLITFFFIFVFISVTKIIVITRVASGATVARDVFFYLSIIIFFYNFYYIRKLYRYLLIFFILFYTFFYFFINVNYLRTNNPNNFIINRINNSDLQISLTNLHLTKNDYSRIYLSPKFYEDRYNLQKEGFFSQTDLIKYNLSPFQGIFKNISFKGFGDEKRLMYGKINSHYKYINNELFLDIYHLKYLLIYEHEINQLKNKNWHLVDKINISGDKNLYLYKRSVHNLSINNFKEFEKKLTECSGVKIDCVLKNHTFFFHSNHKLTRVQNAVFNISNISDKYLVLPFVYDSNWHLNFNLFSSIIHVEKFLMIYKSDLSQNFNEIHYFDMFRFVLRSISFATFSILLLIVFLEKNKLIKLNFLSWTKK
jgi:hypothetical protein